MVVSYNMRRELPRTLYSLSARYQKNIERDDFEIILVDNGSESPWGAHELAHIEADLRIFNLRDASTPSPAPAINFGLNQARGKLIGVMIDGARMVTPGLLDSCRSAARLHSRPVIATLSFHLGSDLQIAAVQRGYTQVVEDALLASIDWPKDGYRLFEIAVFGGPCRGGWLCPMLESNALFMPAELWDEMRGCDERFQSAGGGLLNLDTYERALALPEAQLVTLLGEASFHQVHGGIAANSPNRPMPEWREEYRRIWGRDYVPPVASPVLFGEAPRSARAHIANSVRAARGREFLGPLANDYLELLKTTILSQTHPDSAASLDFRRFDRKRMDHLQQCIGTVLRQHLPGDLVDCGAWHSGVGVFMRGVLKTSGARHKNVWVADSPQPAMSFFDSFGLLDDNVRFLTDSGDVPSPGAGPECIAVLHVDARAIEKLDKFYPRVSTDGIVIVDNCGSPDDSSAIDKFRELHGVTAPSIRIDDSGVFWQKE